MLYGYAEGAVYRRRGVDSKLNCVPKEAKDRATCEALLDINDTAADFSMNMTPSENSMAPPALYPVGVCASSSILLY